VWFTVVIFLTNLATNFFAKPRVGQTMEYLAGAALFGFGVTMSLERA
jgi:threonine/homoserine/homoserine lactone efflux protein